MQAQLGANDALRALSAAVDKLNGPSLRQKINWLRQHRSDDPLDQMQSDAISDLYDAVRQIQEALWPLLLVIPDTSDVRDAAQTSAPAVRFASANFARRF
jgi:uncharacterized protein YjiS (DUF1127 family)